MYILDGRECFYQWDANIKVACDELKVGDKVHFDNGTTKEALTTVAYEYNGTIVADVPNIFLTMPFQIKIYRSLEADECIYTITQYVFDVKRRPKPSDYVYTETEILNYKFLEDRLQQLEEYGVSDAKLDKAIDKYFVENPVVMEESDPTVPEWAKAKEKPKYTAAEVGALPKDTPIPPIRYVESLDFTSLETLVSIRSLESSTYILYGRFVPFEGAEEVLVFNSGMLASIIKRNVVTYMQIFYPESNTVQYFEITDNECSRTNTDLVNMESIENKVTEIDRTATDTQYPSAKATYAALLKKEDTENKATEITEESTDEQYPSAKAVHTELEKKENVENKVNEISEFSTDEQYPSAKAVYEISKNSESFAKKVTVIDEGVTHEQYPSAKAVHTELVKKEDAENKVTAITVESTDEQYPSAKAVHGGFVPRMTMMDAMMFEKFGTGEKDYFFSQANWDDLQRYNRAYVQAYDDENDLRLGEDGKGLYALRAICRFGAGTVPRYPWMKKSDWVTKYRENNPQTELSDEEIITNHPPVDTDFEYMATIIERQPNGFIKVPTGFPTDKTAAQMEGYTVPKKYADAIKDIALAAVPKVECPDKNRYAYTTYQNSKGESLIGLIKMGANPTADVNQPLIRRRVNGAVSTLVIPEANDDAASKYYVDNKFNGANKAVSYGNYSTMITAFNSLSSGVYNVGQNVMIVTLEVPDLWISAVSTSKSTYTYTSDKAFVDALKANGSVKVGYYTLSMLETQKVDLTDIESRLSALETNNAVTSVPSTNTSWEVTERGYYFVELLRVGGDSIDQGIIYYNGTGSGNLYLKSAVEKYEGFINVSGTTIQLYTINADGTYQKETSSYYKIKTAKLNI